MDVEEQQVILKDNEAVEYSYDPDRPYRCATWGILDKAYVFWIGPHDCQVNTPETDAVAKAKI